MVVTGLRAIRWLDDLGDDQWAALRSRATCHEFPAGTTIFSPTPDPHSVYLLESGRARILRLSPSGDEVTLGYVAAGEVFGELPGFGDHARDSYAIARVQALVWRIPLDLFRELIEARPAIAIEITRQMGDRLKRVEARVESLVFGDVRSRLARVLLELAEDFGRREGNCWVIDLGLSQGELATWIGTTRQSVNASMAEMRDEGLIQLVQGRTELLNPARLRQIGEARTR